MPVEQARNLNKQQNIPLSIGHYLSNLPKLADQWTRENYKETDRQRIYLKDIDCPQIWHDKLKEKIPPSVFYLSESTAQYGGPGAQSDQDLGVARAGDLMSCLPPPMRADNMMCYIGHEGTYTPAHREMCASLGQNLMVETSKAKGEHGKPAKPGSSIWFMTETNDRHLVSEYWLATLGHDIEVESHFAQINAWKAAPFKTYIVDQKVGDFILIPPLAPHQVWNRGTRTMKAAWNRTTVETLEMALHEALPRARMVCRDEQYKNKAIVYFALQKYCDQLQQVQTQKKSGNAQTRYELSHSLKIRQLQKDFKRLFALYTEVLLSEMLDPVAKTEKIGQHLPYDSFVTCSYCRSNIFNRFLTCTSCVTKLPNGDEDTYDICMDCYAMGRSCSCLSKYKWVQQFHWKDLVSLHDTWRHLIIDFEGGVNEKSPLPLQTKRKNLRKKTLAQVCLEQLKVRPFIDPQKPPPVISAYDRRHPSSIAANKNKDQDDEEVNVDDEGNVKKSNSKKTRAEKLPRGWVIEHVSIYPEVVWKVAACSTCERHYSYGSLYRMFDLMPQTIMENPDWECPACLKICSCGACRRKPDMKPHEPTGTVLGHDTKKVADPRSVDSLVNFSLPNLGWIKRTGDVHPHDSRRLNKRRDEAERAKAKDPALDDNYVDEDDYVPPVSTRPNVSDARPGMGPELAIDPMLLMDQPPAQVNSNLTNGLFGRDNADTPSRPYDSHDHSEPPQHGGAPMANMGGQEERLQGFTSNGITYEYPDPTMSQPTAVFQGVLQPDIGSSVFGSLANVINSNDLSTPSNATVDGQQMTQLEQMLEEAKLGDRYISTEAKITGKSHPVTLSVSKSKLAAITNRPPMPKPLKPAVSRPNNGAPFILQSDYPSATHREPPRNSKKRKSKGQDDDEFTSHKRQDQKSSLGQGQAQSKGTRRKSAKYTEPASDSDLEEASSFVPVNKSQGPRRLPKYLGQRNQDVVPSSPGTLIELASQGTPQVQKASKPRTPKSRPPTQTSQPLTQTSTDTPATLRGDVVEPAAGWENDDDVAMPDPDGIPNIDKQPRKSNIERGDERAREELTAKTPPLDPALKLAEDNRKAKMRAMQGGTNNDESISESDSSSRDLSPVKQPPTSRKTQAVPKSIFSRPGANGKKIKIVAAKGTSVNGNAAKKAIDIARRSLGAL